MDPKMELMSMAEEVKLSGTFTVFRTSRFRRSWQARVMSVVGDHGEVIILGIGTGRTEEAACAGPARRDGGGRHPGQLHAPGREPRQFHPAGQLDPLVQGRIKARFRRRHDDFLLVVCSSVWFRGNASAGGIGHHLYLAGAVYLGEEDVEPVLDVVVSADIAWLFRVGDYISFNTVLCNGDIV